MTNQIFIGKTWSVFLGILPENDMHRHYSLEICISLAGLLKINYNASEVAFASCIIGSNVKHKHHSSSPQLSILISPLSGLGFSYMKRIKDNEVLIYTDSLINKIKLTATNYLQGHFPATSFIDKIQHLLEVKNSISWVKDKRIIDSIKYIQNNFDKVISLKELSRTYHLSPSRFLHLFKQETHISFRKIQIWYKLSRSFKCFQKNMTLTEIAYECGFADSAHFSKRFKEVFGISPKQMKSATLYNFIE